VSAASPHNDGAERGRRALKAARVERRISYQRDTWLAGQQANARRKEGLRETAEYWTEHCVRCFVDEEDFDHVKALCGKFTRNVTKKARSEVLKGKPGDGFLLCYSCVLPQSMCAKYQDATTGRPCPRQGDVACTYPHVFLDTWACLWTKSTKAKEVWLERIDEEHNGKLDGSQPKHAEQYFKGSVPGPNGERVSRICADVHWFTQTYFRGERERWRQLW
jgi:hypothetical protein